MIISAGCHKNNNYQDTPIIVKFIVASYRKRPLTATKPINKLDGSDAKRKEFKVYFHTEKIIFFRWHKSLT